jgi:hypothetical protein
LFGSVNVFMHEIGFGSCGLWCGHGDLLRPFRDLFLLMSDTRADLESVLVVKSSSVRGVIAIKVSGCVPERFFLPADSAHHRLSRAAARYFGWQKANGNHKSGCRFSFAQPHEPSTA